MSPDIAIRDAVPEDADAIAALHAASWRVAYRGMRSDAYLEGPVEMERREAWRARLAIADERRIVALAWRGDRLLAFACLLAGEDPRHGALVDNLHAAPGEVGRGLGGRVLAAALDRLSAADLARPIHLSVLAPNARARAVYAAWGGREAETLDEPGVDGSRVPVIRVVWPSAGTLRARLGAGAARPRGHPGQGEDGP